MLHVGIRPLSYQIGLIVAVSTANTLAASPENPLLERLLRVPSQYQVLQTSSHNRQGHNGDNNLPLYKDANGDDVLLDTAGPGCVRSIWGTSFAEDAVFKFYFDGDKEPRFQLTMLEFYSGKNPAFPAPLSSYDARGQYRGDRRAGNCFVPIPFEKSLKIAVAGRSSFFHVLYELYPSNVPTQTFTGREDHAALLDAFDAAAAPATAPSYETVAAELGALAPRKDAVIFERKDTAGIVRELVLEGEASENLLNGTQLLLRWDGHEYDDARAPLGMYFGCADHPADVTSLPVTVRKLDDKRVELRCRFPMPFWHHARIVWRNLSDQPVGPLKATLRLGPNAIPENEGTYFTALYHQGLTTYHRDWPLFNGRGCGWFVGAVQSMHTEHYCEGDEHFTIDGAGSPQINGTGSEDYYLGCFWPNMVYFSPFAMSAINILTEGGDMQKAYAVPSSYSRFHLEAPIPFFRSLDARIQHGGMSNIRSNYRSLGFCYLRSRPAMSVTDFIDVGNPGSEKLHGYKATQSEPTGPITARPEGEFFDTAETQDGRRHTGGEITFTVAVNPQNNGVRLRRRLDQAGAAQAAEVYVDGDYAGRWTYTMQNEHLRWFDSDFDLSAERTHGKPTLEIKLVVANGPGFGPFTDFEYEVYCRE